MEISRTSEGRHAYSWKMPLTITHTQASSGGPGQTLSSGYSTELHAHPELSGRDSSVLAQHSWSLLGPQWDSSTSCPEAPCVS